ncbi:hypothetical protein IQ273_28630 [Nodosilinea sp. LEGE 07298]|uniref:hypothetical protein n=1 Tax=Nodosilinea sp. LEGE 07298 TaxID=2777970 RepID=UPI0018817607|nr:hypothetical protein [Nodosilinea sp. LEGE 07298]MBE9113348.1 hypothetical protein [Nodosilinea sp. LEGE 07298]
MPVSTNLQLEQLQFRPGLLNIKPTITEDPSVEELDGELLKIAEDVFNAAKYTVTAVAAEQDAQVQPDSLAADFKGALKSVKPEMLSQARIQAAELVKASPTVRQTVFGRYGQLPSQAVLNSGFERIDQGLTPLKVSPKLLGLPEARISVSLSDITATDGGLLIPQANLRVPAADFESAVHNSQTAAIESGVLDSNRFSQVWGEVYDGDPYSPMDSPEDDFEGQSTTDKLGLYVRKIKCEDETNPEWLGDDEIALAGVSTDEDGDTKKINERYIGGGFKDGKEKNYSSWRYHMFGMREGRYWPKKYGVTFILAEKDNGGLSTFLNNLWTRIRDKVKAAIAKAIEAAGGAVGAIFGSAEIGAAIGRAVGQLVAWVVDKLAGWLIKLLKDDIFKPYTAWVTVPSFGARWNYPNGQWGNPWSPIRTVRFSGFGGRYRLDYQWHLYA